MIDDSEIMCNLRSLAQEHGCAFHRVTKDKFKALLEENKLQRAPFTANLGIRWLEKELFYVDPKQWPEAIHELGHILATVDDPETPAKDSDEFKFFGWELAVVHAIKGSLDRWLASNHNYSVNYGDEIKDLSPIALHKMLTERMNLAVQLGLLDPDGNILSVR